MTSHVEIRRKLRSFVLKDDFYEFIDKLILSEPERILLERFYIDKKSIGDIAEELCLTEYAVLKMHKRILSKLDNLL